MVDDVLVGAFGGPHGVLGEIRLKSYTQDPMSIAGFGALRDSSGRFYEIAAARLFKEDLLIVKLRGVADRDAAQKLTNLKLYVARKELPPPGEDEFYCLDLIGLSAETRDGQVLGTIVAVPNYGAGDILEIAPPAGETLLFPFTRAIVPHVDVAGGKVIVEPPEVTEADSPEA